MIYIKDILAIVKLRIKLLCSSKRLIGLFIVFLMLTGLIMNSYDEVAIEKSSIPIGIIDLDNTSMTKDIIEEIDNSEIIRIISGDKEELFNKLQKNEIFSLFIYEKGFTDKVLSLDTDEVIIDYYPSNNMVTKVVSDVVLAGMLDEICYTYCYKSYYKNTKLYTHKYTPEQYKEYIYNLYKNEDKTLSFRFNIMDNNTTKDDSLFDTVLLYKEIVFAICMIISIIVTMMSGNILINDNVIKANDRFAISEMKPSSVIIGDFLSMTIVGFIFSLCTVCIQVYTYNMDSITQIGKFMLLILAFECTISMIYILIAKMVEDYVAYQLVGSIAVLCIGVFGALYMLGFLINDDIKNVAMYTPLGLLINGYKNLITSVSILQNIVLLTIESVVIYIMIYTKRWRLSL